MSDRNQGNKIISTQICRHNFYHATNADVKRYWYRKQELKNRCTTTKQRDTNYDQRLGLVKISKREEKQQEYKRD